MRTEGQIHLGIRYLKTKKYKDIFTHESQLLADPASNESTISARVRSKAGLASNRQLPTPSPLTATHHI
jgi:hypothetical protein